VPPGFAHGYATLEADCEVIYKFTDSWAPDRERGLAWDDPDLGIDWPLASADFTLTDKDRANPPPSTKLKKPSAIMRRSL
jgi:dTDP-4-dehydrorhamnose 3,5-epimerase